MDDTTGATSHDTSRPGATTTDTDYTLSLEQVSELYAKAGHPRTLRSLQRYCANGHLDARKIQTTLGDKYLVTSQSVARHVAQIEELNALDNVATSRGFSRPVATDVVPPVIAQESAKEPTPPPTASSDSARQETTGETSTSRYVALLERDNEFLRDQVSKKDEQITDLSKRFGETQTLLGAMQRMFAPLLGQADPFKTQPQTGEANDVSH
jgi:hypothetical protein